MGVFAEATAAKYQFSREAQDGFAMTSLTRAQDASKNGWFANEITPMKIIDGKREIIIAHDETPLKASRDKIPQLKPAFRKDGTVTAANSSSISDGAAGAVLVHDGAGRRNQEAARKNRLEHQECRSLRNQRSVRSRNHGGDARPWSAA
jgi:acetyl-CoA acetyltransferase